MPSDILVGINRLVDKNKTLNKSYEFNINDSVKYYFDYILGQGRVYFLFIEDFNVNGTSEAELESKVINIAEHYANGVGNTQVESLIIVLNKHDAQGIANAIYDSRVFYVWEGEHHANGISNTIHDSRVFHVYYGQHEAEGITIAELGGKILGRLLFRGKRWEQDIDDGNI